MALVPSSGDVASTTIAFARAAVARRPLVWCAAIAAFGIWLSVSGAYFNTAALAQTPPPPSVASPPSMRILTGTPMAPADAAAYYGGATTATDGLCRDYSSNAEICPSGSRPRAPEIRELARALRNDPDLIYEYVRDMIETEFIFGTHKGPIGTIINRSGGAFDQAQLMVEVLREAGFTARYRFGDITLSGQQFYDWSDITNARAACEYLAAGGVPAIVNGVSGSCAIAGNVTSITLAHVWVEADISGSTYQFDPSFKPHEHIQGIDVRAGMGLETGEALSAATSGVSHAGNGDSTNFNVNALDSLLDDYASALVTRFNQPDLADAGLDEVLGGMLITPAVRPQGGWRQASPAHVAQVRATWTNVPDQFRARLRVKRRNPDNSLTSVADFFLDEINGRRLEFVPLGATWENGTISIRLRFDHVPVGSVITSDQGTADQLGLGRFTPRLEIDHPFAASSGQYGDDVFERSVVGLHPVAIVYGVGVTTEALGAKWQSEQRFDRRFVEYFFNPDFSATGDLLRANIAATYLAEHSRAAELHARLADSAFLSLHSLGVSFSAQDTRGFNEPRLATEVLDVLNAVALVSRTSNSADRRAALHAIAATGSAVEGVAVSGATGSPESTSTSTRFAFSNRPTDEETTSEAPRPFGSVPPYGMIPGNADLLFEGSVNGPVNVFGSIPSVSGLGYKIQLRNSLSGYAALGFAVTFSRETNLGPGNLHDPTAELDWDPLDAIERGGAFVATLYDANGDPTEIAHILTSQAAVAKGGGAPASSFDMGQADAWMRDRFTDRGPMLGVDLSTGAVGYTSPVLRSAGQGSFPHRLEEQFVVRGGTWVMEAFLNPYTADDRYGFASGLANSLWEDARMSTSPMAALAARRPAAAAQTLAAFAAMQDIWRAAPSIDREVSGLLASDWWVKSLALNTITVRRGASSSQYTRIPSGAYAASTGADRILVSGQPVIDRMSTPPGGASASWCLQGTACTGTLRFWSFGGVSLTLIGGEGTERTYTGQLDVVTSSSGFEHPAFLVSVESADGTVITPSPPGAWSASAWQTSTGLTMTPSTTPRPELNPGLPNPYPACTSWTIFGAPTTPVTVNFADPANGVHRVRFRAPRARTVNQRPHDLCPVEAVYTPRDQTTPAIEYVYDSIGRVKEARDAVAIRQPSVRGPHLFYIAEGFRSERVDPLGGSYVVHTLRAGRTTRHMDEVGGAVVSELDGRGRVVSRTRAWGNRTAFEYDSNDNLIQLTETPKDWLGDPWWGQTVVARAEYSDARFPSLPTAYFAPPTAADPNPEATLIEYNAQGLMERVRQPSVWNPANGQMQRPEWTFQYDQFGRITRMTDPTGRATASAYGENGQPSFCMTSNTADPNGFMYTGLNLTTQFECDAVGNVTATTDPRGHRSTTQYDAWRRRTRTDGPVGTNVATRWDYDPDSHVTAEHRWDGAAAVWRTTTTTYSATGTPLAVTDPAGDMARTCYDALDRVRVAVDPLGRATRTSYNAAGDVTQVERWFTASLTDATCALTPALPTGQSTHIWRRMEYNAARLLVAEYDGNGNATTYAHEGLGRPIQVFFPDPDGTGPQTAAYENHLRDERNNLLYLRTRDGRSQQATYDALRRVTHAFEQELETDWGRGRHTDASFDLAGRPVQDLVGFTTASVAYTSNYETRNQRFPDSASRTDYEIVQPTFSANPSLSSTIDYSYDASSNRTVLSWGGYEARYTYDALNRMSEARAGAAATIMTTPRLQQTYSYDTLSRRASITRASGQSTLYAYEPDNDAESVTHRYNGTPWATYAYTTNPVGQVASMAVTAPAHPALSWTPPLDHGRVYGAPNALNQVASVVEGGVSRALAFDLRGNMTSDGLNAGMVHDLGNRLVSIGATASGGSASFSYDARGRRMRATLNGVTTRFLWSGGDEIAELYDNGAVLRLIVPGPGVDDRVGFFNIPDETPVQRYFHTDRLGSVVAVSSGAAVETYGYSPYGESSAPTTGNPYRFTGRRLDAQTGLYHYRARYYSPRLGQFLEVDPIGTRDDPNLYLYVGLDPLNATDPTGMSCNRNKDGDGYTCRVDENSARLSAREIRLIERAYTRAVNRLLHDPNRTRTLTVNGRSFTTRAGDRAQALIGAFVSTSNRPCSANGSCNRASTYGGALTEGVPSPSGFANEIVINRSVTQWDLGGQGSTQHIERDISRTFIHESFHLDPGERAMMGNWFEAMFLFNIGRFNRDHQGDYKNAAMDFYNIPGLPGPP